MSQTDKLQPASRARLLATSADLFWAHGYRATTTRRIAATLGLQQASLYHHVSSKEDLLYEICERSLARLIETAEQAIAGVPDPLQRLERLVRTSVAALLQNQREHATMAFELRALSPARQTDIIRTLTRYRDLVRGEIRSAQAAGVLRQDIHARYLHLGLFNVLTWLLLWHRPGQELAPDAIADMLLDVFLHGAVADRHAPAPVPPVHPVSAPDEAPDTSDAARRTSERVLRVAASLFRAKGYDGTTAREIATALGIQKASLYHHTRGKAHLLHAVSTNALETIRGAVEAASAAGSDPVDAVRRMAVAHVVSLLEHQDEHATSLLETRALSGAHQSQIGRLRESHEQAIRGGLEAGQRAGVIRTDISARYLGLVFFSLTNRSMLWYTPSGELSPASLGEIFASLFLYGAARR